MSLEFDYGINTGNRFLDLVGHEEDPEEYIANQTHPAEKPKKSTKDSKTVTSTTTTKKTTTKPASATATATGARTNKENVTGKSANTEQRRQQTNVLSDSNNQQTRGDSARGGGRGFGRRGGNAGQDRQPYEGGSRGGGQPRTQRYNKFEGQGPNESGWTEQSGDTWGNEAGNDNQTFGGGYRGRGRGGGRGRGNYEGGRGNYEGGRGNYEGGRGNYESGRGNYEGGRGGGRGRGRGRGGFNRSFEEGSQQQQQTGDWQQNDSTFDGARPETAQTSGQEMDADAAPQERSFEPGNQRGSRGHFRSRTFHNNRNYGSGRPNQYEREGDQEESRQSRRQHDRQQRSYVSGVKPVEKRGGEGAHNWGSPTENPEEELAVEEPTETTGETAAPASKDWSQQVDEAEKQMTLDEYKKQIEAKKRAQQEKVPQFNPRAANEGVDPKQFKDFAQEYRKKNEGEESEEEVEEEDEENEDEEENDEEQQASGKKKVINIPLYFKPIEMPRGGRGRGTGRFRPNRDEQTRSKSPSQQQYSYQQAGEYPNPDQQQSPPPQQQQQQQQQQSRPFRGGSRPGAGRGEYRRSYGNSARGSRGGYNRSNANSNTPDFDNPADFPTLAKQ